MTVLRVIGDVHGKIPAYQKLAGGVKHSLQLGDMGFDYSKLTLDHNCHRFFGGNHDNYDTIDNCLNCLGDYGPIESFCDVEFFFCRGAFSIDKTYRVNHQFNGGGKSWWEKEELDYKELNEAVSLYEDYQPKIMITHTCPQTITKLVGSPSALKHFGFDQDTFRTNTAMALESMFEAHKPDLWIFGHFHKNFDIIHEGTRFVCLPELGYIDLESGAGSSNG